MRLPPERWAGARRLTIAAAVVSVLVLVAFLFVLVRWFDDRMETAIAAFAAGRLDEAEATFQDILEDAPDDVTVLLYLGRINRRQGDYTAAADYLRRAAARARRSGRAQELGHLFMELIGPRRRLHNTSGPSRRIGDERAWIGLILAPLRGRSRPRNFCVRRRLRCAPSSRQGMKQ